MIIKKLNEGTWALSKDRHRRVEDGKKFIVKIEKLKKEIYPVFGDDSLFDELDGAIGRIEELMELPEDQVRESVHTNDDEVYAFNLRMKDIREIIKLAFEETSLDLDDLTVLSSIKISLTTQPTTLYNEGGKYIHIETPLFELKIWNDGFVALENGGGVKFKYSNPLKIYEILLKRMK